MKTNRNIEYKSAPYGFIANIPKGTNVVPANNLPGPVRYWAEAWKGMTEFQMSWADNYGFLIDGEDVAK